MDFTPSVPEYLWAQAVGEKLLAADKFLNWETTVDSFAVQLLGNIQSILDDPSLEDCDCFTRMEEVLAAWNRAGLRSTRHRETE